MSTSLVQQIEAYAAARRSSGIPAGFLGSRTLLSRASVRRVELSDAFHRTPTTRADLHLDGSGFLAYQIPENSGHYFTSQDPAEGIVFWIIDDETLAMCCIDALSFLAGHAQAMGAAGDATVLVRLRPVQEPVRDFRYALGEWRTHQADTDADQVVRVFEDALSTVALEDTATVGRTLLTATYGLFVDVLSNFGHVASSQFDADGRLVRGGWPQEAVPRLTQWAQSNDIEVV